MVKRYKKAEPPVELSVKEGIADQICDLKSQKISVPCQRGCPVHTDIPGYIESIYNKDYDSAYAINLENNVLPGVLGRICVRPCQKECRHNWSDIHGPVEICRLKRVAADRKSKPVKPIPPYFSSTGFKTAIIGGGPAGIAAARELSRLGHTVTIYEKENHLGGMLVDGIPRFRLPLEVVNEEIDQVLAYGIDVKYNEYVDKTKMRSLISAYDAVLVATGTVVPNTVDIKDLTPDNFHTGLDFMKKFNSGEINALEGDIVIIGGGFTAVDSARACARTARKILKNNGSVTIVYRRTEQFMAADKEEMDALDKENIQIAALLSPVAAEISNGKLNGIHFTKNICKITNDESKPEIFPLKDSDVFIPCQHVIIAIGQKQDLSIFPDGIIKTDTYTTSNKKVFLAGDITNGSLDVIHSIADGKKVAKIIDTALIGHNRLKKCINITSAHPNGENGRSRHLDVQLPVSISSIDIDKRVDSTTEVEKSFTDSEAVHHASRCYFCHYKFEIDQDKCIHCNWCIDVTPRKCIQKISHFVYDKDGIIIDVHPAENDTDATFIWINNKNCIRCGKCFRVCPVEAISMRKTSRVIEK